MPAEIMVRPARNGATQAIELPPRLAEGTAPWLSTDGVREAVTSWVRESLADTGHDRSAFVATLDDQIVGFVSVAERRRHRAGHDEGNIGELIVRLDPGRGVGRRLVAAAEAWLVERGVGRVALETGAANQRALAGWHSHGYQEQQITLSKAIPGEEFDRYLR